MFGRLLRLSSTLKNSVTFNKRIYAYHLNHTCKVEDGSNLAISENINQTQDSILLKSKFKSPTKILLSLINNKDILQNGHVVFIFKNLNYIYKNLFNENMKRFKKDPWQEQNIIKEITLILNEKLNKLSISESIEVLDLCLSMNVSYSSATIQILLKNIYNSKDKLSFKDFKSLAILIKKLPRKALTLILEKHLIKKFVVKVSMDLDEQNFEHLENGLFFICNLSPNSHLLNHFINKLQKYNNPISLKNSILIFQSLCDMESYYPKGWDSLLNQVQNYIIDDIDNLDYIQIKYILVLLASRKRKKRTLDQFYNPTFIDKIIQKLIIDNAGFENALSCIKSLNHIKHGSKELLNYATASFYERHYLSRVMIENQHSKLIVLLTGLAMIKYKPIFWNEIQNHLISNKDILNYDDMTLCIVALNLISLDCYPHEILSKIFDNSKDYSRNYYLHWSFCRIYQKLKTNKCYNGVIPTERQINDLKVLFLNTIIHRQKLHSDFLNVLEAGMGGSKYVKSNVGSRLFHIIDHVIVFEKDGTPFPINESSFSNNKLNNIEYIEDLKIQIPPESNMLLILRCKKYWYIQNWNELTGEFRITSETLELLSFPVFQINDNIFDGISEEKRTSHLMNKIRSKIFN